MRKSLFLFIVLISALILCLVACGDNCNIKHTEIVDYAVEPTCTSTGLTEGKHCSVCNEIIVTQNVVPAVAHSLDYNGVCMMCGQFIETPGIVYKKSDDGTYAEVVKYTGGAAKIKIADTYEGLPVKNICDYAFLNLTLMTDVIIPDSVTNIGKSAFHGCSRLTSIVISDEVTSIGESAFLNCSNLTSVVIGNGVTNISPFTFNGCHKLESIVIGDNVKSIGNEAFRDCRSLVFLTIPDSVTSIGEGAFGNCIYLNSIVIPDNVTSIGKYAFENCNLKSVKIGNGVEIIDEGTFSSCSNMTTVTIGNSVVLIRSRAFYLCDKIESVIIGNGISTIAKEAFYKCDYIKDVYFTGSEEEWNDVIIGWGNFAFKGATKHFNFVP